MVADSLASRDAKNLRLHSATHAGGAEVLAIAHHAWRDGARRGRFEVLVNNLARDILAIAGRFAVREIDVVILVDVGCRRILVDVLRHVRGDILRRILSGDIAIGSINRRDVAVGHVTIAIVGIGVVAGRGGDALVIIPADRIVDIGIGRG